MDYSDSKWKYYNHALLSNQSPNEEADLEAIDLKSIWKNHKKILMVRWTSNFDCKNETNWWYTIKDSQFNLEETSKKRRYLIRKGLNNFFVKRIDANKYFDAIFDLTQISLSEYPKKYRPNYTREDLNNDVTQWKDYFVYGCFKKDKDDLLGYAVLHYDGDSCIHFIMLKTNPTYEKDQINAGMIYYILEDLKGYLNKGIYICDGERNINHETNFQLYLEKYFGFRKAFCNLNIKFRPFVLVLLKILKPFNLILFKLDNVRLIHQINGMIKMYMISRGEQNGI